MHGVDHQVLTKNRLPAASASTSRIRAADGGHRHRDSFCSHSIDCEVVFYSLRARIRSITEHVGYLCLRKPLVGCLRIAQQKTADIRRKRNIPCNESTDGKRHPEACWMDLLTSLDATRFIVLLTTLLCSTLAWSQASSTETEVWPEIDVHVQLPSHLRVLAFTGLEQGIGFPFQQWYSAAALGYQFKPILLEHLINIDPDKEHYLVFGGGYEFLRTAQSGEVHHENRITIDATPGFRPSARFLVRDRNWVELRWIDGKYSTTYRNQLSVERDFLVHEFRFTPYGSAEVFYDGPKHSWDQEWYTTGIQLPIRRLAMVDIYYRREHCITCTPTNWNAAGITLNLYFQNAK
jgi:hypothetical protein